MPPIPPGTGGGSTARAARTGLCSLSFVHLFADLLQLLGECFGGRLDLVGVGVLVFEDLLDVLDGRLDVGDELVVVELLLVLL